MEIKEGTWLLLDNGMKCMVCNSNDPKYKFYLNYWGSSLNEVPEHYLEDSIRYKQPIAIEVWYKNGTKTIEYVHILKISDSPFY